MIRNSGSGKLPLLMLLPGAAALALRRGLYAAAVDAKGLLIQNHPLEIALLVLTAAALLTAVLAAWKAAGELQNTGDLRGVLGNVAAGLGILVHVVVLDSGHGAYRVAYYGWLSDRHLVDSGPGCAGLFRFGCCFQSLRQKTLFPAACGALPVSAGPSGNPVSGLERPSPDAGLRVCHAGCHGAAVFYFLYRCHGSRLRQPPDPAGNGAGCSVSVHGRTGPVVLPWPVSGRYALGAGRPLQFAEGL